MTQHALISRCEDTNNILQHQIFFDVFNYLVNETDTGTLFHKGGVKGYIVEETGEFVPVDQFEDDEKYDDAYIFNTFCDN